MEPKNSAATTPPTTGAATSTAATTEPKVKWKTSRGMKPLMEFERGFAKASARVSKAVAKGYAEYLERRDRSAERRRDGALRDAPRNFSSAAGKTMKVASRAPFDFADEFSSKRATKRVRRAVRAVSRMFPM